MSMYTEEYIYVKIYKEEYIFTERNGRKGPPAGNKAKRNGTNTPHSKATRRKAKPNQEPQTHTRGARQAATDECINIRSSLHTLWHRLEPRTPTSSHDTVNLYTTDHKHISTLIVRS
jgi:hypothetical protein